MLHLLTLHQYLNSYLLVALLFFVCGLHGLLAQRTPFGICIAGQLLCGAACLNIAAFSHFLPGPGMDGQDGQGFALLAILLAGASTLSAGVLFFALFRTQNQAEHEAEHEEAANGNPACMDSRP